MHDCNFVVPQRLNEAKFVVLTRIWAARKSARAHVRSTMGHGVRIKVEVCELRACFGCPRAEVRVAARAAAGVEVGLQM
eukprot:COSAG06_NODE_59196_length_275_cov_0.562500_1_plen_78_part_01